MKKISLVCLTLCVFALLSGCKKNEKVIRNYQVTYRVTVNNANKDLRFNVNTVDRANNKAINLLIDSSTLSFPWELTAGAKTDDVVYLDASIGRYPNVTTDYDLSITAQIIVEGKVVSEAKASGRNLAILEQPNIATYTLP
jgi:hypothetical protein